MDLLFGALWIDLVVAAGFGLVGGLGLGLLQEKGLEIPHVYRDEDIKFANLGFIADILIGALAAVIIYAFNPPNSILQMVAATVTAGIGGSAILKSYVKGTAATQQAILATQSQEIAKVAIDTLKRYQGRAAKALRGVGNMPAALEAQLNQLQKVSRQIKHR